MTESQIDKFRRAAREAGADMSKEEFARVVGGLAKPKQENEAVRGEEAEGADDA